MQTGLTHDDLEALVAALVAGDEYAAVSVVRGLVRRGVGGPELYVSLFQPALRELGGRWADGRLNVAEEHRATALVRWLMDLLAEQFAQPVESSAAPVVVTACVAGERHELGLLMVSRFLRRAGFRVVELGADVPDEDLAELAKRLQPVVLVLSATRPEGVESMARAIRAVRGAGYGGPVMAGGAPFLADPSRVAAAGADLTATDAPGAVQAVRDLYGVA